MSEKYVAAELRRLVTERAGQCCEYCRAQARYSSDSFTVDHITPHSPGGPTTAENLALACHGCNQHKSTRTAALDPVTGSLVPLFRPREQAWEEHFAWNEDFTLMLGLTATGRATVAALQLNRARLDNLRRGSGTVRLRMRDHLPEATHLSRPRGQKRHEPIVFYGVAIER